MDADTFDERLDRHQSYSPLLLDEQGWVELNDKLMEVLDWALEEQSRAAVRIRDEAPRTCARGCMMLTYTGAPRSAAKAARPRSKRDAPSGNVRRVRTNRQSDDGERAVWRARRFHVRDVVDRSANDAREPSALRRSSAVGR